MTKLFHKRISLFGRALANVVCAWLESVELFEEEFTAEVVGHIVATKPI
jgi:hypothetical protein